MGRLKWLLRRFGILAVLLLLLVSLAACFGIVVLPDPAKVVVILGNGTATASIPNLDAEFIRDALDSNGYAVALVEETSAGLTYEELSTYSVVVYSSGTYSHMIPAGTEAALAESRANGIGLVVVSDDAGTSRLTDATHLSWGNNYGEMNPTIALSDFDHPVLEGLQGASFDLVSPHGDVDAVEIHDPDVQVIGQTGENRLPALLTHDDDVSREVVIVWEVARTDDSASMRTLIRNAVDWVAGNGPSPKLLLAAELVSVVDGDTIFVDRDLISHGASSPREIRYTGIDTTELTPVLECGAVAGTEHNADLLSTGDVWVELDERTVDNIGRVLGYVHTAPYLDLSQMVNYRLLADGYARIFKVEENWRYVDDFRDAQLEAARLRRGLWSAASLCDAYSAADVVIAAIQYWSDDEFVIILNRGSTDVNLAGWTLENATGDAFAFPGTYDLEAWSPIVGTAMSIRTVHSGPESNQAIGGDMEWVSSKRWVDEEGVAILKNASGEIVHEYRYRGF